MFVLGIIVPLTVMPPGDGHGPVRTTSSAEWVIAITSTAFCLALCFSAGVWGSIADRILAVVSVFLIASMFYDVVAQALQAIEVIDQFFY